MEKNVGALMKEIITKELVETFSKNFIEQLQRSAELIESNSYTKRNDFLPDTFTGDSVSVNSFYSVDREHLMIVFMKNKENTFNYSLSTGNVFDVFDPWRVWDRRKTTGIRIENSRNVKIKSVSFEGMRPIDIYGEIEIIAEDFIFSMPYPRNTHAKLEYVMIFSKKVFLDLIKKQRTFANQLVLSYSDYFENTGEKFNSNQDSSIKHINYLKQLKISMAEYFFTNVYKETDIDDFIANHPEILKYGLGLIKYQSQIIMKDINGEYGQDLRPDLIGFDSIKESWFIVDYKLPWKKVVRGSGTVRASLTSEITVLKKQLKVYRDYFSDNSQRRYVNDFYKLDVKKYPPTIGVIGTVKTEERDEFNEERLEQPGWFKIISYDELYKKVCEYIDVATKIE